MIEDLRTLVDGGYVQHKPDCKKRDATHSRFAAACSYCECTCGLSALLARVEGATAPPQDATTALIEQWLKEAQARDTVAVRSDARGFVADARVGRCTASILRSCANQLAALSSQAPPQAWRELAIGAFNLSLLRGIVDTAIAEWEPQAPGPIPNGYASGIAAAIWSHAQLALTPPADQIDPSSGAGQTSSDTPRATDPNTHGWPEGKL